MSPGGELDHVARHKLRDGDLLRSRRRASTVAVTEIMALSFAAALSALAS